MKEQFLSFIKEQDLFNSKEKILLTVSGGIDSMTMLHLFHQCGFNIAVAHCNFGLRGSESDGDEELVSRTAQVLGLPIHINRFETLKYADENKISIQMAARDLRYKWFDRLSKENNYTKIATAHNANDVVETMLINLTRGTGIHGLTGIRVKNNSIIRPILFASRKDVTYYASENKIQFREDSSNAETKYLRNAIRHEIIPQFEKLNPSFLNGIIHTASILNDAEQVFNKHIQNLEKRIITQQGSLIYIEIPALISNEVSAAQLYEIISAYNFSFDTTERLLLNINNQPGATYFSNTHKIVKDRTAYILYPLTENEHEEYLIQKDEQTFNVGSIKLDLKQLSADKNFILKRNREVGNFDLDKLKFPLKLRHWKQGDFFYPYGMRGKKKLSDYFSDQKVSIPEKENIWILCSGEDIIWVVNHRTDNRFCITNSTKEVLQVELID